MQLSQDLAISGRNLCRKHGTQYDWIFGIHFPLVFLADLWYPLFPVIVQCGTVTNVLFSVSSVLLHLAN